MFLTITFLISIYFQSTKCFEKLTLRAFHLYYQILCILKHVEDVKDRSSALKGCNAMYVEDVKDVKRTYTYIFVQGMWHVEGVGKP